MSAYWCWKLFQRNRNHVNSIIWSQRALREHLSHKFSTACCTSPMIIFQKQKKKKKIYIVIAIPRRASAAPCTQGNKQPVVSSNVLAKEGTRS
jgi:hypothetical protein